MILLKLSAGISLIDYQNSRGDYDTEIQRQRAEATRRAIEKLQDYPKGLPYAFKPAGGPYMPLYPNTPE